MAALGVRREDSLRKFPFMPDPCAVNKYLYDVSFAVLLPDHFTCFPLPPDKRILSPDDCLAERC